MRLHGGIDLVDDAVAGSLNAQRALRLHHVVRSGGCRVDAFRAHDGLQVCPLNQQVETSTAQVVDDCALDGRDALDDHLLQRSAERLQRENLLKPVALGRQHVNHVCAHNLRKNASKWAPEHRAHCQVHAHVDVVRLQLQLRGVQNRSGDAVGAHCELQGLDGLGIQLDLQRAVRRFLTGACAAAHLDEARARAQLLRDFLDNLTESGLL